MSFSALDRNQHLALLSATQWDLIVIGGGITGAGILLDAVSRGLKAALVEKNDFASGTSGKSTKLIHGGLRYLKNFEFGLVREVGRERAIVHANARHLVRPEPMLLPIYRKGSIGRITGSIGLWFYDLLADVDRKERRRMLSREETLIQEPLLRRAGLLGSGLYYEYRTDDARLTLAVLMKAAELGGLALNYCAASGFLYANKTITGIRCIDQINGLEIQVNAHVVVNATGPWLDTIRGLQHHETPPDKKLVLTKGIHIVIPRQKLPIRQSIYFDVPDDGRMIFGIPRDQAVYVGTTDTMYDESADSLHIQKDEIEYLTEAVNHVMEEARLSSDDIIGTWAGLRPLVREQGKAPSELSRKDEIFQSPEGLISIAGGKLTGYRKMAERVVDLVLKLQPHDQLRHNPSCTRAIRLTGGEYDSEEEMEKAHSELLQEFSGYPTGMLTKLFYRYGGNTHRILSLAGLNTTNKNEALIFAEVAYSVRHEMTHHFSDFVQRRTADLFFDREYLQRQSHLILSALAHEWGWDTMQISAEASLVSI